MKRLFGTFTVLLGLWLLAFVVFADPPSGSMKYNRYTTNNTAQIDAYIASVAGSASNAVSIAAGTGIKTTTNNGVVTVSLYTAPTISSFVNDQNTLEVGTTVNSTVLTWVLTGGAITSQSLDNGIGSISTALRTRTHTSTYTTDRTYVLTVTDGVTPKTASTSITFKHKAYWGASANTSLNDAQVIALTSAFATSRLMTESIAATNQYVYVAYPASFGAATFTVDGFSDDGWTLVTRSFVNASGSAASYNIYRHTLIFSGGVYSVTVN